ncbi:hypothetical protein DBV15_11938 [Temnothorax longispinosus]|uniref:THAP-type domain-containing protein n=1 Tax=Temnothorax longispinosus TaxID=300112 RepID=A0A4S2K9Q2_9HYME|nr:hypothetical protein DBV15_11938 [Temnothorax longispinosus]
MVKPCAVPKCNKNSKSLNLKCSLFKIPVNEILRDKWRAAIPGLKATQFVCDRHFDAGCIVRKYVRRDANGQLLADIAYQKPRLTSVAVPTIFLTEGEFDKSTLQQNKTENEASMDLDSSQQEQKVAITSCEMIAHDPSQQASKYKRCQS